MKISLVNNGFLVDVGISSINIKITEESKKWITRITQGENLISTPIPSSTEPWISNRYRDKKIHEAFKIAGLPEEAAEELLKKIIMELDIQKESWLHKRTPKEIEMALKIQKEQNEIEPFKEKALDILKHKNPLKYMINAILKRHIGDLPLVAALILSFPALQVKGHSHKFIIGPSEKGKSDACDEVGKTFPLDKYESLVGSSAKSKIYAVREDCKALEHKIFYYDDTRNNDQEFRRLIRIIKDLEPGEERFYETVIDGKYLKIKITGNCCVWESAVESPLDKQDYSRALICKVEESKKHERKIEIKSRELQGNDTQDIIPEEYLICKAMYYILMEQNIPGVIVPYWKKIAGVRGGRGNKNFIGLIKGNAVLNFFKREKNEKGKIIADLEDFEIAKAISLSFTSRSNLTEQEKKVIECLPYFKHISSVEVNINKVESLLDVSYPRASGILVTLAKKGFIGSIPDPNRNKHKLWYKINMKDKRIWLLKDGEEESLEGEGDAER